MWTGDSCCWEFDTWWCRAANTCTSISKTNKPITKLYPLEVNTHLDTTVPITVTDTEDNPAPSSKRCTADPPVYLTVVLRVAARRGRIRVSE